MTKELFFMKKLYFLGLIGLSSLTLNAAEGDTTTYSSHQATHLETYMAYDAPISFPTGNATYRKITMEFELGKYACPNYDPSNPGEGPNQTGWCGDWDYDVHILVCNADGDTMELGRLITPYANSNFPRTPLSWKHSYLFDVTDYYPLLKDNATIRIFYAGWSGGFTGTVNFHFIEGTPPRNVLGIDPLWRGSFSYGNTSNPIDSVIKDISLTTPANTDAAEMKLFITGHGGDNTQNCAEFCKKWYRFKVDGTQLSSTYIWRDDCNSNFLYPQSGTWVYSRGNWCPGDLVHANTHKVPAANLANGTFDVDIDFQNYSSPANQALYKISANMFYYGPANRTVDAGIEEIISPNIEETYYRSNPICGSAQIKVKNFGSQAINSIKFEYGVEGFGMATYVWNGSIASFDDVVINLPATADLNTATGSQTFKVQILEVNGNADEDAYNNTMTTSFEAAPKWDGGNFRVDLKMSGAIQNITNKVNWKIVDLDNNVLFSRNGTENTKLYQDTVHLENGCYKLVVDASNIGYGMSFFNAFSPKGYIRVFDLANGNRIALPKTDLGSTSLEANFGEGFVQEFTVTNSVPGPTGINDLNPEKINLKVYPNPAQEIINIDLFGSVKGSSSITLFNTLGQIVHQETIHTNQVSISTKHLNNGIYTLHFENNGIKKVEKVVIAK